MDISPLYRWIYSGYIVDMSPLYRWIYSGYIVDISPLYRWIYSGYITCITISVPAVAMKSTIFRREKKKPVYRRRPPGRSVHRHQQPEARQPEVRWYTEIMMLWQLFPVADLTTFFLPESQLWEELVVWPGGWGVDLQVTDSCFCCLFFTFCFYFLLFAVCFLLFTFCFLLFTFYFWLLTNLSWGSGQGNERRISR